MEKSSFSSRIKKLRSIQNLTQTEFADKIGTTQATLSSYENTDKTPSLDIVKNIAEIFTVSIDWLLGFSDVMDIGDKPRHYSDIIRILFKLEEATIDGFSLRTYYDSRCEENICELSFTDSSIVNFIDEWKKIKDLHDKKTIDDELYDLWIEKTLKKYDKPISHCSGFLNIPDGIDEELPFT